MNLFTLCVVLLFRFLLTSRVDEMSDVVSFSWMGSFVRNHQAILVFFFLKEFENSSYFYQSMRMGIISDCMFGCQLPYGIYEWIYEYFVPFDDWRFGGVKRM